MPLKTLLLSKDSDLVQCISKLLANLDFAVEHCSEPFAAAKCLMDHRFDAIIVDCDDNQGAAWVMQSARMAAMNKSALTLAISGEKSSARGSKLGENFHLNKPLDTAEAERTLRTAKDTILKNSGQIANASKAVTQESSVAAPAKPPMNAGLSQLYAEASVPVATQPPSHKPVDLPSAPELLAKMDEAFPPAPVSHASIQGSAAAAAPAREAARPSAAVEQKKSAAAAEPTSMRPPAVEPSKRAKAPDSSRSDGAIGADPKGASRTEPKMPPKSEAERAVQSVALELRRVNSQQHSPAAPAKAAKTPVEAAFPAVQPIPAEVAAGVTEEGPLFGRQPQDDSPRSSAVLKIAVLAGALIAVIAGVAFSRHAHHSSASTVPASSNQPVAASPSSSVPFVASENDSVAVEPAASVVPTPKPNKTAGQAGDSVVKPSKAAADPVIGGEQIAVRLPGAVSSPAAAEEQPVAPPTGVSTPSVAPNFGSVVAPLPAAMPVTGSPTRVAVSQGVSQGLLIRQVKPVYPLIARASHISGTVQLRAVIAKDGSVGSLNVVGGHPLLTKAAMDAVRQWRYKPYRLNGQPVEVETQISIEFKM